jgi:hypothetical protein
LITLASTALRCGGGAASLHRAQPLPRGFCQRAQMRSTCSKRARPIQMTADTYGHLFPRRDDGAELAMAEKALLGN